MKATKRWPVKLHDPLSCMTAPGLIKLVQYLLFLLSPAPILLSIFNLYYAMASISVSPFPDVEIPSIDLWSFLFERSDRPYPLSHRTFSTIASCQISTILIPYSPLRRPSHQPQPLLPTNPLTRPPLRPPPPIQMVLATRRRARRLRPECH